MQNANLVSRDYRNDLVFLFPTAGNLAEGVIDLTFCKL